MKIVLFAMVLYVGLVHLAVWVHLLIGRITGELSLSWSQYIVSALVAPIFLSVIILLNPIKLWRGIKAEARTRKKSPTSQ